MTKLQTHLKKIGACAEACKWAGARTPQRAWDECERADWLLWWATKTSVNTHQQIVLASCICARTALKYVPDGELRPLQAIEAAENWVYNPTEENRLAAEAAARAAEAAAWAAEAAWAAAEAAVAAAWAAEAAWAAARAAEAVEAAARAAAWAAARAAEAAAWAAEAAAHKTMCLKIRELLQCPYGVEK